MRQTLIDTIKKNYLDSPVFSGILDEPESSDQEMFLESIEHNFKDELRKFPEYKNNTISDREMVKEFLYKIKSKGEITIGGEGGSR